MPSATLAVITVRRGAWAPEQSGVALGDLCLPAPLQDESTGEITFYMKGADVVMAGIVRYNDWLEEEVSVTCRGKPRPRWHVLEAGPWHGGVRCVSVFVLCSDITQHPKTLWLSITHIYFS